MKQLNNCPVCSSNDLRKAYRSPSTRGQDKKTWPIVECGGCGHEFMNPQPSWEELLPYYGVYSPRPFQEVAKIDAAELQEAQRTGELRHVRISAGMRLLDVGCSSGRFIKQAAALGAVVTGIEPRERDSDYARSQGLDVFCGTLADFIKARPGETFDIITANHVVEHMPNPVEVLHAMKTLLAPGGLIWISVPNAGYSMARALKGRWHSTDVPLHLMQFTPKSIIAAGESSGLKVRRQVTDSPAMSVATSMRQYLRYVWKVPVRISGRLKVIDTLAKAYARRVDEQIRGEAILTEFSAP